MTTEDQKYPIGKFIKPEIINSEIIKKWRNDIELFPSKLTKEVSNLTNSQLDTAYRTNGWTIRQVIHHCADSHINGFIRFKLALTEDNPIIKPYFEDRWAELSDSKEFPIEASLKIIEGIHERWSKIIANLTESELEKTFFHPEHNKEFQLIEYIGNYAWHSNHHLAHITTLKQTQNW